MSAISQSIRFKLGDFCRHLFHKPARDSAPAPAGDGSITPPPTSADGESGGGVTIPLRAVLAAFPPALRPRIRAVDTQGLTLTIPFGKVFPELSRGVVTMPFAAIRCTAPQVFTPGLENDDAQVVLPLNEILSRIDPALLARRPMQRKPVNLPDEISSPFAGRGTGLSIGLGHGKPANATREPAPHELGSEPTLTHKPALPVPAAAAPTPVAPLAIKLPDSDERPLFVRKPIKMSPEVAPTSPGTPPPPPPPLSWPPKSQDYLAARPVPRAMQPAKSEPPAPAATGTAVLIAPLATIAAAWPEALRQEIAQTSRPDAQLAMPVDLIESSLKRGRVTFAWKTLRSWISPAVTSGMSPHDAAELELPLSVVAPLFLARQKGAGQAQRVTVDEAIPDLFFGLPRPEPAPTPKLADTNFYTWAENSDIPRMDDGNYKGPKAANAEAPTKHATPNEIVARAAALNGVVGALIALPEGLLVASRVPTEFNGDTLAAFLPQIFTKVSQVTKELRLGELNNLNFTVGNVPWKIFRVNTLYFAAFGCVSGPLPTGELARLAAELDHRR